MAAGIFDSIVQWCVIWGSVSCKMLPSHGATEGSVKTILDEAQKAWQQVWECTRREAPKAVPRNQGVFIFKIFGPEPERQVDEALRHLG